MSRAALLAVYALLALTHFVYYPKWAQSNTEATLSYDVSGYYLYLPAAFIYDDLREVGFLPDIIERYRPTYSPYQVFEHPSGARVMKYSIGQAVTYAPWFFLAHAWASASAAYPADGFSFPYQFLIAVGSLVYAFLGLYWLWIFLRRHFSDGAVAATLLTIGFATNYLNYAAIDGAMTHNTVFTGYAALLLLTDRYWRRPNWRAALGIGAVVGLMALTRPTEILAALIPLLWGWFPERRDKRAAKRHKPSTPPLLDRRHWPKLAGAAAVTLLVGSLQLLYWKAVSGDWVVYSYEEQGFDWLSPHLREGLFSYKAGWLVYTPVMVFALLGFWPLFIRSRRLFVPTVVHTGLFIYVAFAWSIWWYGGSLGQRTMVQAYAVLALPLTAFFAWLGRRPEWLRLGFLAIWGTLVLHNLWFTHQAHRGGLFASEQMTEAYYWKTLFKFRDEPTDRFYLDNHRWFPGPVERADTLLQLGFESFPTASCGLAPINGGGSLCLTGTEQNSPIFRVDTLLPERQYVRATVDCRINARRDQHWHYTQMLIDFYRGDDKVGGHLIRMHRVLNDDWGASITLDGRVPKGGADAVSVSFWNGGSAQPPIVLDNLVLLTIQ